MSRKHNDDRTWIRPVTAFLLTASMIHIMRTALTARPLAPDIPMLALVSACFFLVAFHLTEQHGPFALAASRTPFAFSLFSTDSGHTGTNSGKRERSRLRIDDHIKDNSIQVVFLDHEDQVVLYFSDTLVERYDLDNHFLLLKIAEFKELIHKDDIHKACLPTRRSGMHSSRTVHFRLRLPKHDHYTTMFHQGVFELPQGYGYTAYDATRIEFISEQLEKKELAFRLLEEESRKVLEKSRDLIVKLATDGTVIYASDEALRVYEKKRDDVVGQDAFAINESVGRKDRYWFDKVLEEKSASGTSVINVEGKRKWIRWSYEAIPDDTGAIDHVLAIGHEITHFIENNRRMAHDRDHDPLTNLLNQQGLYGKIAALNGIERAFAFFVDVRGFSRINDYYGHKTGDEILVSLAQSLVDIASDDCFVCRYSGDEFVVFAVNEEADEKNLSAFVERFADIAFSTHEAKGINLEIKTSIGFARFPEDTDNPAELIPLASLAMQESAKTMGNRIVRYKRQMSEELEQNILVAARLGRAIDEGKIDVHFQKVCDVSTGNVPFVEQLARWHDEDLGAVLPEDFLDIARDANLLDPLERYLIDRSFSRYKRLRTMKGYEDAKLSLNLSPEAVLNPKTPEQLADALAEHDVKSGDVCLEISEKTFVHNLELCLERIRRFKREGFLIALDDFGKEYSSLSILENVAFDIIKIDSVFTEKISSPSNQEIIRMIRRIAHLSHKEIIAEGVETANQKAILQRLSCNLQQGFLFHLPEDPFT